jgi:LysM repeat protein
VATTTTPTADDSVSAQTSTSVAEFDAGPLRYRASSTDSLASIALLFCSTPERMVAANEWAGDHVVAAGEAVLVPSDGCVRGNARPSDASVPFDSVAVAGDMVAADIGSALERLGAQSSVRRVVSSGLSRPDYFDWLTQIAAVADELPVGAPLVFAIGANDAQLLVESDGRPSGFPVGSEEWVAGYRQRVQDLADAVRRAGHPLVWVGVPAYTIDEDLASVRGVTASALDGRAGVVYVDADEITGSVDGSIGPDGFQLTSIGRQSIVARVVAALNTLGSDLAASPERHVVEAGDTLGSIAERLGIDPTVLAILNGWADGVNHALVPGQSVAVPHSDILDQAEPPLTTVGSTIEYTVRPGDFLPVVALQFCTTAPAIADLNGWTDGVAHPLIPGEVIAVPAPCASVTTMPLAVATSTTFDPAFGGVYMVRPGDYLSGIAAKTGTTVEDIVAANGWVEGASHIIVPGDQIRLPSTSR